MRPPSVPDAGNAIWVDLRFWVLLAIAWFATMGWRPMLEPDEGRYAEIPREMQVSGDWVTPRLNAVKYFEKPPLQYWATASFYSMFGVTEWTSRAWSCALAFLCLPLTFAFARHLHGSISVGVAAVAALAINPYFAIVGQLNLLDSGLAFFLTAALCGFLRAGAAEPGTSAERKWMSLAAVALAFATLSKGIIALVLSGGTLALYMLTTRDVRGLRRWHLPVTLPLYLLVTAPWFIVVSVRNPEFPGFFFIHEHFARYLTDVSDRVQPWWFFLPTMFLAALPWLVLVGPAVRDTWRSRGADETGRARWFLLLWCVFTIFFFSISHSKLPTYVLPVMPALAVLLAPRVAAGVNRVRTAAWTSTGLVVLVAIVIAVLSMRASQTPATELLASAGIACAVGIAAALFAKRSVLIAVCATVLAYQALIVSYSALPPLRTSKALVAQVRPAIGAHTHLFSVDQYRQSIPPYLGRTLRLAIYKGELEFGIAQQRDMFIDTLDDFIAEWLQEVDAVAFIDAPLMQTLNERRVPMRIVGRDDRTVAIARQ